MSEIQTAQSFTVPDPCFVEKMVMTDPKTAQEETLVFDKPYFLKTDKKYILRMMYGRPTIWEIEKKPNSMNHIFVREATQG